MKKNIFKLLIFILMGSLTTSCFGDLDTSHIMLLL